MGRDLSDLTGTLISTVFTLVVCLVVVGLSGAAVLHIVLSDAPQRATLRSPPRRDRPAGHALPLAEVQESSGRASEAPAIDSAQAVPEDAPGGGDVVDRGGDPAPAVVPPAAMPPAVPTAGRSVEKPLVISSGYHELPGTRLRSATLLVVLLATLGVVLAALVVLAVVLAAVALRGALR